MFYCWSVSFPDYEERIREMGLHIGAAILFSEFLALVPKE